jgi:hypothetical protein
MPPKKEASNPKADEFEQLIKHLKSETTVEKIQLIRNSYIALSGLATAILLALTQTEKPGLPLELAKIFAAISIPLGITQAYLLYTYIHLGEKFLDKYNQFRSKKFYILIQYLACMSVTVSVFSIAYFLSINAFFAMIVATFFSVIFFIYSYVFISSEDKISNLKTKK